MRIKARFETDSMAPEFAPSGVLDFSTHQLAHALFTTGRAPGDRVSHGATSLWEFVHRATIIPAYLRVDRSMSLRKSRLAAELDRSEKAVLSYSLGQAMASIYCRSHMQVSHLLHVDRYGDPWRLSLPSSGPRPDLFGQRRSGQWVVVEAKGRSNGVDANLIKTVKQQKSVVSAINGRTDHIPIGSVVNFPPLRNGDSGAMKLNVIDPPNQHDGHRLVFDENRFLRAYYQPFVTLLESLSSSATPAPSGFHVVPFPELGMKVGLADSVARRLQSRDELTFDAFREWSHGDSPDEGCFSDGTYFWTDWDDQLSVEDFDGAVMSPES